jgi:predicted ATPase
MQAKPYLKEISLKRETVEDFDAYPFCIPGVRKQTEHYSVTRQFLNGYQQMLTLLMEP